MKHKKTQEAMQKRCKYFSSLVDCDKNKRLLALAWSALILYQN